MAMMCRRTARTNALTARRPHHGATGRDPRSAAEGRDHGGTRVPGRHNIAMEVLPRAK